MTRKCTPPSSAPTSPGPMRTRLRAMDRSRTSPPANDAGRGTSVSCHPAPHATGGVEVHRAGRLEDKETAADLEGLSVDEWLPAAHALPLDLDRAADRFDKVLSPFQRDRGVSRSDRRILDQLHLATGSAADDGPLVSESQRLTPTPRPARPHEPRHGH